MQIPRPLWLVPGYLLLGIGLAGFYIPGLPGTVFLILALACFKKGSPKMEKWMLANKVFGPFLRDWEENRWISMRVKIIAVTCIVVFSAGSMFSSKLLWARILVGLLAAYGAAFVIMAKTKPASAKAGPAPGETAKEA